MDEPVLQVRDGAMLELILLGELLHMYRSAFELAEGVLSHAPHAKETAEAVMHKAESFGPQRARSRVSAFLLRDAMVWIEERKKARAIVAPAESVAGEASTPAAAAPAGAAPPPGAAPVGPCQHPADIACPNCAAAHLEARNAKKRAGARA